MRKLLFSAAALVLASSAGALASTSARAADAPVCAMISGDAQATYCNFVSFQQCQAFVSGQGGACVENFRQWTGAQARYLGPITGQVVVQTSPIAGMTIEDDYNPHQP